MNKLMGGMMVLPVAGSAAAQTVDVSGNIGFKSDYIFRGVQLSSSSANGGIDLTAEDVTPGTWYVGTWLADVGGAYLDFGYGNTLKVQDTELFDWTISLIRSFDMEVEQGLCGTSPCPLGDDTSIVLELTRSFGVWSKKKGQKGKSFAQQENQQ